MIETTKCVHVFKIKHEALKKFPVLNDLKP